jgi:hypothetical protein
LKFVDKLPEILVNVFTKVVPKLLEGVFQIYIAYMRSMLIELPRMLADAIANLFRRDKGEMGIGANPYDPGTRRYAKFEEAKKANEGRSMWADQYGSREQTSRSARAPYLDPRLGSGIIPGAQMAGVTVNLQAVGSIPDQAADEIVRAISRAQRRGVR